MVQKPQGPVEECLAKLAVLPLTHDDARPQHYGVLKFQLLHRVLHAVLHLGIREVIRQHAARAGAGDEDEGGGAGLLSGLGDLDVQIVVDLPLVSQAAGFLARGTETRKDGLGSWSEAREDGSPFCGVGIDDGVENGRGRFGCAAGYCGDRSVELICEEGCENIRADEAG